MVELTVKKRPVRNALSTFFYRFEYRRLQTLRGKYSGQRAFIVASGPSLSEMDLSCLGSEFVCVLNNGVQAIGSVLPQASMHVSLDNNRYRRFGKIFEQSALAHKIEYRFFGWRMRRRWQRNRPHANRPYFVRSHELPFVKRPLPDDLFQGVSAGSTVVLVAAQIIAFMGFSEIYILGCDLDYGVDGTNYFHELSDEDAAHSADPEVQRRRRETEGANAQFEIMKTAFEANKIKVMNAGVGGKLEALPRLNLSSLFSSSLQN